MKEILVVLSSCLLEQFDVGVRAVTLFAFCTLVESLILAVCEIGDWKALIVKCVQFKTHRTELALLGRVVESTVVYDRRGDQTLVAA